MRNLEGLTIAELAPLIESKAVSVLESTRAFLDRIHRLNPDLNAYVTLTEEQALADARRADAEIHAGSYRGPLHGIPFCIKDNLATAGVRTTAGSKMLGRWVPDYDATVVARLKEAGVILLGKSNMHEWAAGCSTMNPFYGTTRNPWDRNRVPGGSSGGSAAAVAAGLCLGSIGTDNAGSIRNPASLCGVVGFKATHGRVSRYGGVAGTGGYSTDHFGPFSRTVRDSALILQSIAGRDDKDPLSSHAAVPDYSSAIGREVRGLRVGIVKGYFDDLAVGEVREAVSVALKLLESLGMSIEEVSIPHAGMIPAVQLCISRVENLSPSDPYLRTRPRDYSPPLLERHIRALTIPAATYVTAQRVRRVIRREFDQALERVDVIVAPTVSMPASTIEECEKGFVEIDGRTISLQETRGSLGTLCTIPFNVTGDPALSLTCGFSSHGVPIGLQVAAGAFQEVTVLRVAHAYEQAAGWYRRTPVLE